MATSTMLHQDGLASAQIYAATLANFKHWLLAEHSEQARAVIREGDLAFDAYTAGPLLELAKEWQARP